MVQDDRERNCLQKKIQLYGFAIVEANLFLDTHPTEAAAIEYYNKYQKLYTAAVDEFTQLFGPITLSSYEPETRWSWVDEPWPWEMEA